MRQSTVIRKIKEFNEAHRNSYYKKLPGRYRKRTNDFVCSNFDLNLTTMLGHSYQWYELVKLIKGRVVLNSYNYSPTTCKHVNKARRILKAMGVRFVEIEAPQGLQDLGNAANHAASELARAKVRYQFARIKYNGDVAYWNRTIKLTRELGGKQYLSNKDHLYAALKEREIRLKRQREFRVRAKTIVYYNAPNLS